MGLFASPRWLKMLAWPVAVLIAALNAWLLYQAALQLW
jgi:manganese transport protein